MARLNVLEYTADFVRGWPQGAAIEMNYPAAGVEKFGNGDIVAMTAAGTFTAAAVGEKFPIVIARGVNDTFNAGGTGTNNLYKLSVPNIGIMSNYVVRTSNVESAGSVGATVPTAGQPVGIGSNGKWALADGTAEAVPGAVCLEVETGVQDADGNTLAAVATILVK